jgi:hypothetical protein
MATGRLSGGIKSLSLRGDVSRPLGTRFATRFIWAVKPFVEQTQRLLDGDKVLNEVPSTQRRPVARALAYYQATNPDRNTAIVRAYAAGGYTLKAIGEHFGLHYSTVSGIVKRHKSKT